MLNFRVFYRVKENVVSLSEMVLEVTSTGVSLLLKLLQTRCLARRYPSLGVLKGSASELGSVGSTETDPGDR